MTEEQTKPKSPLPKKSLEAVVKEEPEAEAGYKITLTFNEKAELMDICTPDMKHELLLEHLTFAANWMAHGLAHGLVEKGRKA